MKRQAVFIRIIMILMTVGLLAGCTAKTTGQDAQSPGEAVAIEVDFNAMFNYDVHESLYYSGTGEYGRSDTIERIDEIKSPTAYRMYQIERNIEDMSGGYAGDLSSLWQLKISDDTIAYFYKEGIETVLAQKPIIVGNTWQTKWLTPTYGFVDVTGTVTETSEDGTFTVAFSPIEPAPDLGDFEMLHEIVFNQTNGIIEERYTDDITRTLVKTTSSPSSDYVSRYVNPSETLAQFYTKEEMSLYVEDGEKKTWLWSSEHDDAALYSDFETYISQLDTADIRSISRAQVMLAAYMKQATNDFELVEKFVNFFQWTVEGLDMNLLTKGDFDPITTVQTYYAYDYETANMYHIPSSEQSNPTDAIIADLLYGNGVSVFIAEGYPYFKVDPSYLIEKITTENPKTSVFLQYKSLQYDIFPMYTEGYLIKSAEDVAEALYGFEQANTAYPNEPAFEDAKYYSDYFFEALVVPTAYEAEGTKYHGGGYLDSSFYDAYKGFVSKHPDSKYTPLFKKVMTLLDQHYGKYSNALNAYLISLGFETDDDFISEALKQESDFDALKRLSVEAPPTRSKTVVVTDIEGLIKAIAPNTEIVLNPGAYEVPYENIEGSYAYTDNGTIFIHDVKGLTLRGKGTQPTDIFTDTYLQVLDFEVVEDVYLQNLRIGHEYAYCVGDVIDMKSAEDITLNELILFGCGYRGLYLDNANQVTVTNSLISDCQASAFTFVDVSNVYVSHVNLLRNGEQVIQIEGGQDLFFENLVIHDNTTTMYEYQNGLIKMVTTPKLILDDVDLEGMPNQAIIDGSGTILDGDGKVLYSK